MARPQNAQRPLHPFSPFNPVCAYGDVDITVCQDQIYYMTGRLQTILLQRIDGPHTEQQWHWWNVRFCAEVELASALIGWAVVVGTTVDIPYLLRTICAFLPFIQSTWKLTYTPEMHQLLHAPPPELSSRAIMFLRPRRTYLNEWWKSGSGEDTPLNMERLQVAYSPLEIMDAIPLTVTPARATEMRSEVTSAPPDSTACSKCTASRTIARRAVVALRDCAIHMEASRQFAEWSAGQSQRVIKACRRLCLERRKIGHTIGLEDLARLGAKDTVDISGDPRYNQATTYPSADGINWDLFPYEDTQGPLLSPDISQIHESLPRGLEHAPSVIIPSTTGLIGKDGFNIDRWTADVPPILPVPLAPLNSAPSQIAAKQVASTQTPVLCFVDASVQVPFVDGPRISSQPLYYEHDDLARPSSEVSARNDGPYDSVQGRHQLSDTFPDIIMEDAIHTSSGTDVSSAGLSSNSSGTAASSNIESDGSGDRNGDSDMDEGSNMEGSEYENEEAIAAGYTGD